MKNWTITDIENIAETEAKEMSLETMEIKGHNIYFVDFGGAFGYSCLVFKNKHHIHYVNDYELHHNNSGMNREALRQWYIDGANNILFTEEEIAEPIKDYNDYELKSYYLHNYYGMQVDYISAFRIIRNKEEEKAFDEEVKGMIYNPVCFSYMNDGDFVNHHIELLNKLEAQKDTMSENYDYWKDAFLREMYNHEYGINWEADYDTLSAFGNIEYHGEEENELKKYFQELKFTDQQKQAYMDARREYYKNNEDMF